MTRFFRTFGSPLFLVLLTAFVCLGQSPVKSTPRPFAIGETLTYEGKISKIIQGIAIADLTFRVEKAPDSDNFVFKTEAVSKGTLLKIFRYSFLQQYESMADPVTLRIVKTTKHDVQKDRVRDSIADFDYKENRVSYTETDPKDPNRPPRRIASSLDTAMMNDIVSGIYVIRSMALTVGKTFVVNVSDSGLVYEVPVRVAARELQKTIFGRIWCYRIEPQVFGPGYLIGQKGSMTIWLTDDARRLPIRSRINTQYGKVEVKLKSATPAKPAKP